MKIEEEIRSFTAVVEEALNQNIQNPILRYAVLPPGKLIRPLLVYAGAYPYKGEEVLMAAMAVELIHSASLVHDDLPFVDNSNIRRGKPSLHAKYGPGIAVMAGDALFSLAFQYVSPLGKEAVMRLAEASGIEGIAGGQMLDLRGAKSLGEIEEIHLKKTAKLMEASLVLGLISAGRMELIPQGERLGREIGLLFQAVDDIVDRETCAEEPNLVKILGIDKSLQIVKRHYERVNSLSDNFPGKEIIKWLAEKIKMKVS